jgi:hypothetical protein
MLITSMSNKPHLTQLIRFVLTYPLPPPPIKFSSKFDALSSKLELTF